VGTTREVQDTLPSRHDLLAVRYADRSFENRVMGAQHERDKSDRHCTRGLWRDNYFLNSNPGGRAATSVQKQNKNSSFFFYF